MDSKKLTVFKNFDFSDYINKLKESVKKKEKLTLQELNNIFKPANVVFTNYEDYFKTIVDEKEKEAAPTKEDFKQQSWPQKGLAFALYNTNIDKINIVIELDIFIRDLDSHQFKHLEMVLNHESIHVQQVEQMGKENYKLDISPVKEPEKYFSREDEIMAYANSAVYELLNIRGYSKENVPDVIKAVFIPDKSIIHIMNNFLSDENYKLFKEYMLLYLEDEPVSQETKKEEVVEKQENINVLKIEKEVDTFTLLHNDCEKTCAEPNTDQSKDDEEKAMWWIMDGEKGMSSETMWACFMNRKIDRICYPYDPDDFKRCYKLLETVPNWKLRLIELKKLHPVWETLVDNWDKLTEMYEQNEKENWKNYKKIGMYEFMKEIIENSKVKQLNIR